MWCYHKPGFETLLLAELQRQQQRNQFCDTLLKAEGVSVPAHSCVLSAISPQVSSALLSSPAPPAGQSRMLEFQALGACTLLHMVRLLYSGEMAGEGEREKEEAISAAANLGIQGLVEVTERDQSRRNEMGGGGGGQHAEVGVQTEPSILQETRVKWRRASRDENTFLWKESLWDGEKDTWTQTETWQVNTEPPPHSPASFEPNNMAVIQDGAQSDAQLFNPQIPCIPISLVFTPENQDPTADGGAQMSITVPQCMHSCSAVCSACHKSWVIAPQGAATDVTEGEEWQEQQIEEFQDNIPGFINNFLNPEKKEGTGTGLGGQRQRRPMAGVRRAGTGERKARIPQTTTRRGKGGWMQTVDVQDVGVSRLQKQFLHRWRASRAGQGGGAAGRKLYLKSREDLKKGESSQKRRRSNKSVFEESGETTSCRRSRENRRGERTQGKQDLNKAHQRTRAKSASLSSTPVKLYNSHSLPRHMLLSLPPTYLPPASSLLHTTCLPPLAPLPHEDQPEQIDRLLEEVMMGLDIISNDNNSRSSAPQCRPTARTSNSCTYGSSHNLSQKTQPEHNSVVQRAGAGFDGSHVAVVAKVAGGLNSAQSEEPVLQQQGEGELNMMLEHFLQSFEQQIDNCKTGAEMEEESSKTQTVTLDSDHLHNSHAPCLDTHSGTAALPQSSRAEKPHVQLETHRLSAQSPAFPKQTEELPKKVKKPRRRRRMWTSRSMTKAKTKVHQYTGDILLRQMPVVRLTKHALSVRVTLQEESDQSLEVKCPTKPNCTSSESRPNDDSSEKNQLWSSVIYPLRSRMRKPQITTVLQDAVHLQPEPLQEQRVKFSEQHRSGTNGQLQTPSDAERSSPPFHSHPEETCRSAEQSEEHEERSDGDLKKPQEQVERAAVRGRKRCAGSEGKRYDAATKAKRICSAVAAELPSDTCADGVEAADALSENPEGDVENISLVREEGEAVEATGNVINNADGDRGGEAELNNLLNERRVPTDEGVVTPHDRSHSVSQKNEGWTISWEDEDIDVVGWCSPLPRAEPEIVSWTVSSEAEDEEEDVDVV